MKKILFITFILTISFILLNSCGKFTAEYYIRVKNDYAKVVQVQISEGTYQFFIAAPGQTVDYEREYDSGTYKVEIIADDGQVATGSITIGGKKVNKWTIRVTPSCEIEIQKD